MNRGIHLISLGALAVMSAHEVRAQTAVERNLPPAPQTSAAPIVAPDATPASQDATPIGGNLRTLVLLDAEQAASTAPQNAIGVELKSIPRLDRSRVRKALARFIGQPLSRRLIAEIQAEIALQSRRINRPFVSLSTPEQELSGGVLQIRVTEFYADKITVKGLEGDDAISVKSRVRLQPGQYVNSAVLSEDLDWLNRSPFRETSALFAPASESGATDLTLSVKQSRPYRLYAGWSNTGSQSTGLDRFYVGALSAIPGLRDAYASYQLTGSSDFWIDDGDILKAQPRYVSQGARLYVPTFARQNLEFTFSDGLTNQVVNADFTVRQRTTEGTLGYRMALSELGLAANSGDVLFAIEGKRQRRKVFFGGERVVDLSADVWQVLVGWSKGWQSNGNRGLAALNAHISPGGISDRSSGASLAALTDGRISSDRYSYVTLDVSNSTRLPGNFALSTQVSAQYAGKRLPLSAQIGLGGDGLVRAYTSDDGSFDAGVLARTELRLPPFELLGRIHGPRDQVAPFIFIDAGYGRDHALKTNTTLVSAGFGADYTIGRHFSAGLNSAWALKNGQRTERGDWRVQARTTVTF